jgi:elongation factor Ts
MAITANDVSTLRKATQAPMLDCKKALEASAGDFNAAVEWLRKKGLTQAAKKAGREASEGVIESYIHTGNRVGVLVEVNCETDFVARSDEFRQLVHNLMLQIAMSNPLYMDEKSVPADVLEKELGIQKQRAIEEGKSEQIAEKVAQGRLAKFYQEVCLLNQPFIKDEEQTVGDLIKSTIGKIGENILVHRFVRYELGK